MKINDKNLSAYSTSASPVDKEGWLCKRGELNKGYQKRWFVLKGNLLFYFDRKGEKEPLGVIILEGCSIGMFQFSLQIDGSGYLVLLLNVCLELAENDDQFSFKIIFHGPHNRTYILGSDSQESMEQWMKALVCASYDYMKFMVADLQRQLKELEGIHRTNRLNFVCYIMFFFKQSSKIVYICIESPLSFRTPNTQEAHQIKPTEQLSPQPPSRSRTNPFNKPINLTPQRKDNIAFRKSFKEFHNQLGRPILRDRNEWRFGLKKQELISQEPLITL